MAKAGTIAGSVEAFNDALSVIEPPPFVRLRPQDRPFWEAIVRARAKDTWNDIDLVHAANLARTQSDIEAVQKELEGTGWTVINSKGTEVANPRHSILETLSRRAVALSRSLQVHAHATVGESRDQVPKAEAKRNAQRVTDAMPDDGLIARPH